MEIIGENCKQRAKKSEETEKQRYNGASNSITDRADLADINLSKTHLFSLGLVRQKSEEKGETVDKIFLFIDTNKIE